MLTAPPLNQSLKAIKSRLNYASRAWSVDNHERLLRFFVSIVPQLVNAERCTVFTFDPTTGRLLSKIGTFIDEDEIDAPLEGSVVGRAISSGQTVVENRLSQLDGYHQVAAEETGFAARQAVCVPIKGVSGGRVIGAIQVLNKIAGDVFAEEETAVMEEVAGLLSMALDNVVLGREMQRLSSDLDRQVSMVQSDYLGEVPFVAQSDAMRRVIELVQMVCDTPVNVLIQGENGTGKEVIARLIHEGRDRRARPFVAVNCAAIPETLMESEFFGYERGAFTGAHTARRGRFEEADGGTLFLDEVADIPLSMQPKFLRAIQEEEGARLGANQPVKYSMSIISASNKNLRDLAEAGQFRQDLFYRLFAVEIVVPPLRERAEDIAPLAAVFLEDVCRQYAKEIPGFSEELITLFERYSWPGNVRQLRREIERLVALTPSGELLAAERCSPEIIASNTVASPVIPEDRLHLPSQVQRLEIQLIERALSCVDGNKGKAARLLGITRQGLHKKLKRYELSH